MKSKNLIIFLVLIVFISSIFVDTVMGSQALLNKNKNTVSKSNGSLKNRISTKTSQKIIKLKALKQKLNQKINFGKLKDKLSKIKINVKLPQKKVRK